MNSFPSLPRTLLALSLVNLFSLPALAVTNNLPPTSFNDPFRAIVLIHRTLQPEPPLCCLKPLPTIDFPQGPEGVLLSFEEWKSKQLYAGSQRPSAIHKLETFDNHTPIKTNGRNVDFPTIDTQLPSDLSYPTSDDALPPHFRVPIVDRFNYASMDCSARVHTSHKSAKSSSAILSAKKDKYMLSPCGADAQFVVVELCEDIRIDTVQLANFEFFSGVFKDFSVSVAKTYTGTGEGWTPAGTYRAKNVRGVQSFHPPTSLRDFYRYIRIDFHSHYGHEYYCPISLLRVYGLTHLEEWKWDIWLAESHARLRDPAAQRPSIPEYPGSTDTTSTNVESDSGKNTSMSRLATIETHSNAVSLPRIERTSAPIHGLSSSCDSPSTRAQSPRSSPVLDEEPRLLSSRDGVQKTLAVQSTGIHSVTEAISSLVSISSPASVMSNPPTADHPYSHSHDPEVHPFTTLSSQPSSPPILPQVHQPLHTPSPQQGSGESIYRTIMNRLTTLEANHSLYARYVEEQTAGVREVLRKLNEEVGRLESVSQMQAQMYRRTVHEWERQRLRLELEHGELLSRVNYLSDEVVLEKRLSIAQLCLLLAVLVFIGLTRGAPAQHLQPTVHRSAREWGIRNLSFGSSTEGWNPLRQRRRSSIEQSRNVKVEKSTDSPPSFSGQLVSPSPKSESHPHTLQQTARAFKWPVASGTTSLYKRGHSSTVFRTPTKPRSLPPVEPHTLPRAESITRSHSSTSSHPHVRSTKRWARTAHLHEVKVLRELRGSAGGKRFGSFKDRENDRVRQSSLEDVFSASSSMSPSQVNSKGRPQDDIRRPLAPLGVARSAEESTDADLWIDTDVDVDTDDVSVVSERAIALNSHDRDVFG